MNNLEVLNPFKKGTTGMSWFFEQSVYLPQGLTRSIKAGGGSGNIPKVIVYREVKNEQ